MYNVCENSKKELYIIVHIYLINWYFLKSQIKEFVKKSILKLSKFF